MAPIHPCHPQDLLEQSPKRWLSIVTIKLIFTIHDDIFQRLIELKIFMWAKNISSTH